MGDMLQQQLALQTEGYGYDPRDLRGEDRVEFIRWNVLAAIRELTELLDEVDGWKPWQTERENAGDFKDQPGFIQECVDVWHFLMNLLLTAGVDEEEIFRYHYNWKREKNKRRQEVGYAGVGKEDGLGNIQVEETHG